MVRLNYDIAERVLRTRFPGPPAMASILFAVVFQRYLIRSRIDQNNLRRNKKICCVY